MSALAAARPAEGRRQRLRLATHSVRLRLTLLYAALFVVAGAALLAITYALVAARYHGGLFSTTTHNMLTRAAGQPGTVTTVSSVALGALVVESLIALAIMAAVCLGFGWVVAGRVLRPLRTITDAVREISASDLHRRLALEGPDDELRRLGATFDGLLGRLEAAFEAQRRFVANASHELRTPLTLQRTLLQLWLADANADDASRRETAEEVLAAGARQERLIEALLALSRSQAGLDRHDTVDLTTLTRDAVDELDQNDLTIETTLEPAYLTGDPELVGRLLANLLGNAVRHNLPRGRVEVTTRTVGGAAMLTITNAGPDVPAEQLTRLFQPFQRLQPRPAGTEHGFGLGLSIVDAIAAAHGATVNAQPNTGGGLRVEVTFPAPSAPPG